MEIKYESKYVAAAKILKELGKLNEKPMPKIEKKEERNGSLRRM